MNKIIAESCFGLRKPQSFYISIYNDMYKGIYNANPSLSKSEDSTHGRNCSQKSVRSSDTGKAQEKTRHSGDAPDSECDSKIPGRQREDNRHEKRNFMDIQSKPEAGQGDCRGNEAVSFKGKPVKVIITGDAKEEFERLNHLVAEEKQKGIMQSNNQILLRAVQQKIELLKINPEYGVHIPKNRIPHSYIVLYDVNNLWKINLSGAWRMIYTLRGSEIDIISLILDLLDHSEYNKKFGYRKR